MDKVEVSKVTKQGGFTLVEVMVTVTIATILMMVAVPNVSILLKNNRMSSLKNDFISGLALARSTAVTRGNSATVCASNIAGTQCETGSFVWVNGWLVFDDIDNDGVIDSNETTIAVKNTMPKQTVLSMSADTKRVSFDSEGSAFGFSGEFAFCDDRGDSDKIGLIISNSGRSRAATAAEVNVSC